MTTFADIRLALHVFNDAPGPVLDRAILEGLQEVCKASLVFDENIELTTVADQVEYTLTPTTTNTAVCAVKEATFTNTDSKKKMVPIVSREEMERSNEWWQTQTCDGDNIYAILYDGATTVRLSHIPDDGDLTFHVLAALYPTDDITIPANLDRHLLTVKDYVRSEMYILPEMPWTNEKLAAYYRNKFQFELAKLKAAVARGFAGRQQVRRKQWR